MTHTVITLLSVAVILAGTATLAGSSCSAVDQVASSWQRAAERAEQMARTEISREGLSVGVGGENVRVTLKNRGHTSQADFSYWDVIVQYYGQKKQGERPYFIKRLGFTQSAPGDDEWRVEGIFEDAQTNKPEVFEPDIFNPGEEIKIHMKLKPKAGAQTTNWVIVTTSNGITVPVIFTK